MIYPWIGPFSNEEIIWCCFFLSMTKVLFNILILNELVFTLICPITWDSAMRNCPFRRTIYSILIRSLIEHNIYDIILMAESYLCTKIANCTEYSTYFVDKASRSWFEESLLIEVRFGWEWNLLSKYTWQVVMQPFKLICWTLNDNNMLTQIRRH